MTLEMASYSIIDMNDGTYCLGKTSGKKVVIVPTVWRLVQKAGPVIRNIKEFDVVEYAPLTSFNGLF